IVTRVCKQVVSQPVGPFHLEAALQRCPVIYWSIAQILVTPAANRVEPFECVSIGIHAGVAPGATGICTVLFRQFPDSQRFGSFIGRKLRYVFWRAREFIAE